MHETGDEDSVLLDVNATPAGAPSRAGRPGSRHLRVTLAAFTKAGRTTQDAYSAVKTAALAGVMVGMEQGMSAQGKLLETVTEALPADTCSQFHALKDQDPTAAWSFNLETVVAGLRAQILERATPSRDSRQ